VKALDHLKKLVDAPRHDFERSLLDFPSLDVDLLAQNLELEDKGADRGIEGDPKTKSKGFDVIEKTIVDRIKEERKKSNDQYTRQTEICVDRLRELDFEALVTQVQANSRGAIADFDQEARNGKNQLYQLRRELIDASESLDNFKKEHEIDRPAHRQSGIWSTIAILSIIFSIESLANAGLMGDAYETGYIGAFSFAIALGFINVGSGYLAGFYFLRSLYHSTIFRKSLGVIGLISYTGFCIFFNFYVAHVRDALQTGGLDDALKQVWPRAISGDINFSDFQAPVMLFVGIAFSLMAFIKGFRFDDPFPDYGRRSRQRDECESVYANEAESLSNFLTDRRDQVSDALQDVAQDLSNRRNEYFTISSTLMSLASRFDSHQEHLETAANRLLAIYREANWSTRAGPAPKHFDQEFELDKLSTEVPLLVEIYTKEKIQELLEKGQKLIEMAIDDVNSSYEKAYRSYNIISQILSKKELESAVQEDA
jgi:hypothetical protein